MGVGEVCVLLRGVVVGVVLVFCSRRGVGGVVEGLVVGLLLL